MRLVVLFPWRGNGNTATRAVCRSNSTRCVVASESARRGERTVHPRRHLGIVVVALCIVAAEFGLFVDVVALGSFARSGE